MQIYHKGPGGEVHKKVGPFPVQHPNGDSAGGSTPISVHLLEPDQGYATYNPLIERNVSNVPKGGSWKQIRKSGSIKMTPMNVVNERTENFVGAFTYNYLGVAAMTNWTSNTLEDGSTVCLNWPSPPISEHLVTNRFLDLSEAKGMFPSVPHYTFRREFDSNQIEAQKAAAWQELFQAYNLGEELYELRDSIHLAKDLLTRGYRILSDSKGMFEEFKRFFNKKSAVSELPNEALSAWMEYRYGIMPIIYSLSDIIGLSNLKGKYRTVRKRVSPRIEGAGFVPNETCFFTEGADNSSCNITVKSRYASEQQMRRDLINVNLLTTAATVYPYAFVVRWFVNVNSFLDAQIKSLTTLSTQHVGCIAFKDSYEEKTYFRWRHKIDRVTDTVTKTNPCGNVTSVTASAGPVDYSEDQLLQIKSVNNYRRILIQPNEVKLVWNPYLDWKRGIDSLALTFPKMQSAFRRLI